MKKEMVSERMKKYIYRGIGLASHSKEIIHNLIGEVAKQGRLSEADGGKIVNTAVKNMQKHLPDIEGKYRNALMKVLNLAASEMAVIQNKIALAEKKADSGVKAVTR